LGAATGRNHHGGRGRQPEGTRAGDDEHGKRGRPTWILLQRIIHYFNVIWDEAEELQRLAELSDPKVTIETGNAFLDEFYCQSVEGVKPGQYVLISVTDTGSGMPGEVIDKAFDPFFTTKAAGAGTGLGLSQVYGFIRQSGGHVRIYSEIGEGTTVKIYLPRSFARDKPLTAGKTADDSPAGKQEVVLVVEDDADVRAYVVETLSALNYSVREAANAAAALSILDDSGTVDLLLTDVVMPGMNGRNLAEAAKLRRPGLKVLYMTGYSRNAIVHQGRLDAGVSLMQKPFSQNVLAMRVRTMLEEA